MERSKFCIFSVILPAKCTLVSLQDFTIGGSLSASSL
jgi:hypothetical protein